MARQGTKRRVLVIDNEPDITTTGLNKDLFLQKLNKESEEPDYGEEEELEEGQEKDTGELEEEEKTTNDAF